MKEHVILVHGTYAYHPDNYGTAWWQKGSKFTKRLQNLLGENYVIGLGDDIDLFSLSGENKLVDRCPLPRVSNQI